jgi:hypothetical protein
LVFVASPRSIKEKEQRIRILYPSSFFTELVEQETKLTIKTKTKFAAAFERTVALKTQDPDKTILLLFLFLRIFLNSELGFLLDQFSKKTNYVK